MKLLIEFLEQKLHWYNLNNCLLKVVPSPPKISSFDFFGLSISEISDIIIAIVNLLLAFYIFIYQRNKDKKADKETIINSDRTIRLQWFKDIIIQPNFDYFTSSFDKLINHPHSFHPIADPLSNNEVDDYIVTLKHNLFQVRRNFVSLLEIVDQNLYKSAIKILDDLLENLTVKLLDSNIDLSIFEQYENIVLKELIASKNKMVKLIYTHKGN